MEGFFTLIGFIVTVYYVYIVICRYNYLKRIRKWK